MVSHDCVAFYLLSRGGVASTSRSCSPGRAPTRCFAGYDWYPPLAERAARTQAVEAYAEAFFDRPHAELARILEPEWLLDDDPSRAFVARALRPARAPTTALDAALRLDTQSCWSTTRSSGSTT